MKPWSIFAMMAWAALIGAETRAAEQLVLIGTYSQRGSEGIYAARLDLDSGKLSEPKALAQARNPSFLALHPGGKFLYAVNEVGMDKGKPAGAITAYAFDREKPALLELNSEPTQGTSPCHLAVDASASTVVAANYSSGNAAVFPLAPDGLLRPAAQVLQHEGKGPNKGRQEAPHAHGVTFSPANDHVFITDLGIDRVVGYRFDAKSSRAERSDAATAAVAAGSGARHFVFHPDGKTGYAVNEMDGTVTTFAWDAAKGVLQAKHVTPGLPPDFSGKNGAAEIAVHPSGKFLYSSNRGHDSIAVFALGADGKPVPVQHQPTGGRTPRGFAVEPSGRFLLCANMDTDNLVVFRIDAETGRLSPVGSEIKVPAPVCVLAP